MNEAEELLAQTQLRNQRTIALDVDTLEVLKHIAALTDHQQQPTRPSLRAYDCPFLLEGQCQTSQTDPLPACLRHVGNWLDHRYETKQRAVKLEWGSNTGPRGD